MLEREPSQRGHVIGRTCLEGWCDSILTFSFPSSACLTSWGISKYLTINLQYFRDFPPGPFFLWLIPVSQSQKTWAARTSPVFPPCAPSPCTFSFLPLGLATLSWPQLSPAPDFPVPGSGWASALGVVVRTLVGRQCVLSPPCCLPKC